MTVKDKFASYASSLTAPATGILTITPSDTTDLTTMPRALMVATAGDVAVVMQDGTTGTIPALQPGIPNPLRIRRVLATGTTATGIVGLY